MEQLLDKKKYTYQVQDSSLIKYKEILKNYNVDVKKVDINDFISFMSKHFLDLLELDYKDKNSKQIILSKLTYDLREMYYFLYRDELEISEETYVTLSLKLLLNKDFVKDLNLYLTMVLEEIENS